MVSAPALLQWPLRQAIVAYWHKRGVGGLIEVAVALPLVAAGLVRVQSNWALGGGRLNMVSLASGGSWGGSAAAVTFLFTVPIALRVLARGRWVAPACGGERCGCLSIQFWPSAGN
jgi:hypothetical protein